MKVGIDTNVLFYAINKDNPFHSEARKALAYLVEHQSAVITQQNLVELAAALTKRGAPSDVAGKYVSDFLESIPVLRPTPETMEIFLEKMRGRSYRGTRLFDLYLAATLMSNGVNLLYTYNDKDFYGIKGLQVWKPDEQSSGGSHEGVEP